MPTCSPDAGPAPSEVLSQLENMLGGRRFATSERNANFLRYIVQKTLQGETSHIKEVVIASEVYGRAANYDPKSDSIVRVEATRLRTKLRNYYDEEGRFDPIRISIPTGGYVPLFERTAPAPATARRQYSVPLPLLLVALAIIGYLVVSQGMTAKRSHVEALVAWQAGRDLIQLDPHTAMSESGAPGTLLRAIEGFEVAVSKDPSFGAAWESLAEAYDYAYGFVGRDRAEDLRRAETAARRSIALNRESAAGHAMVGLVSFYLKWDLLEAERYYRRAIALDARSTYAISEYADLLRETGRVEQAEAEIRKARSLQPSIPALALKEAEIQMDQNRNSAALSTATKALELKTNSARAHVVLGTAFEKTGDHDRALEQYRGALSINARDRRALPAYGYLLGRLKRGDEARAVARTLEDLDRRVENSSLQVAVVYAGLGDLERSIEWLVRALATRQSDLPLAAVEYRLAGLHGHPRFETMLRQLGLQTLRNVPVSHSAPVP